MTQKSKSLIEIHAAVLLFGLSGMFGKLLELSPQIIVLGRVFFSSLFLLLVMAVLKQGLCLRTWRDYFCLIGMGLVLALHWTTFFMSIQISTVAIGLLTFSTFPVFVTFLEPWFFKERLHLRDVILAVITLFGVFLVIPDFHLDNNLTQGALWGLVSGFTYGILSMMNRKYANAYPSVVVAFYEQASAAVFLMPVLLIQKPVLTPSDVGLLLLLGVIFTGVSHTLFIHGMKHVRTQVAGIISSLEPVYGILFAAILIHEIPSPQELVGGLVILGTVFYATLNE